MPRNPPSSDVPVPRWLMIVASVAICWHLGSILVGVLAAPSGPWPAGDGASPATPPQFAFTLYNRGMVREYLQSIRLSDNYHFSSNRSSFSSVYLEVLLKDDQKQQTAALKFPDDQTNSWVRHRQDLLGHWLGDDQPVIPPNEAIAAPGQKVQTVVVWEESQPMRLRLREKAVHLIERDQIVMQPSQLSLILARSYSRYLCRAHQATAAEIVRHHRDPIPPRVLTEALQSDMFSEIASTFGELPR